MKKGRKRVVLRISLLYFYITCFVTFIFILAPLLIRIPIIYSIIGWFLEVFKSIEYKSIYIETIGAILGTFLAVTGTLLTQNLLSKYEKRKEDRKNALVMYYDLKFATKEIADIVNAYHTNTSCNTSPNDPYLEISFRNARQGHYTFINSNWRQLIASLEEELTIEEILDVHILYGKLLLISKYLHTSVNKARNSDESYIYDLMSSVISNNDSNQDATENGYDSLIEKLAKLANIKNGGEQ